MTLRVIKKLGCLALCLLAVAAFNPRTAHAEDAASPFSLDTSLGFYSDYMFRGFIMFNGNSIQPAAAVNYDTGYGKVSVGGWMHVSADATSPTERFTEIDQITKYSVSPIEDWTFTAGHIYYNYPEDNTNLPETQEFFGSAAWSTLLNPSVTVYHDYNAFHGQYYELGFSQTLSEEIGCDLNLTPYVIFGFASNLEDKVYKNDGLVQTTLGLSTNLEMGPITAVPSVNYTAESDEAARNNFWFGINFTKTFS